MSHLNPFVPFQWRLAHGRDILLGPKSVLMGILNVTPDSFSDGGEFLDHKKAIDHAQRMISEGATIIDIGGESSRPGHQPVEAEEEQRRVLPVIARLARDTNAILSVDTWRGETAEAAIAEGAHIINDIHGLQRDPSLADIAARTGAGVVAMHTGRDREKLADVIEDQLYYLSRTLEIASKAGIGADRLVLDPGFGFAKETPEENVELLARMDALLVLGRHLLTGTSRKRFIRSVIGQTDGSGMAGGVDRRDIGTVATSVVARLKGSTVFRVHDVAVNRDALAVADAIIANGGACISASGPDR